MVSPGNCASVGVSSDGSVPPMYILRPFVFYSSK